MRILALDAATEICSVAVRAGGREIARSIEGSRDHAQRILGLIDAVLAEAGVCLSELDAIATSIGPGAFTGVRITIAVAQGLAYGASLKVIAVTTLEALAFAALAPDLRSGSAAQTPDHAAFACLDARMGEVYIGCYTADRRRGLVATLEPRLCAPAEVVLPPGPLLGVGRGLAAYPALATLPGVRVPPGGEQALPDARAIARLGIIRLAGGEGIEAAALEPLYLRERVALTEAERAARTPPA